MAGLVLITHKTQTQQFTHQPSDWRVPVRGRSDLAPFLWPRQISGNASTRDNLSDRSAKLCDPISRLRVPRKYLLRISAEKFSFHGVMVSGRSADEVGVRHAPTRCGGNFHFGANRRKCLKARSSY